MHCLDSQTLSDYISTVAVDNKNLHQWSVRDSNWC